MSPRCARSAAGSGLGVPFRCRLGSGHSEPRRAAPCSAVPPGRAEPCPPRPPPPAAGTRRRRSSNRGRARPSPSRAERCRAAPSRAVRNRAEPRRAPQPDEWHRLLPGRDPTARGEQSGAAPPGRVGGNGDLEWGTARVGGGLGGGPTGDADPGGLTGWAGPWHRVRPSEGCEGGTASPPTPTPRPSSVLRVGTGGAAPCAAPWGGDGDGDTRGGGWGEGAGRGSAAVVRWHSRGCGELSPRVPTQSRVRPHPSVPGCRDSASPAPQWGNHRPRRINCRAKRLRNEQSCSSQRLGVNRGFPLDSSALTLWGWGLGFGVEGVLGSDVSFCSVLGVNRALLGGGSSAAQ